MNLKKKISFEELQKIRAACLENAKDLNSSTETRFETGELHIAFHLTDLKSYCDAFFLVRAAELVRDSVIKELDKNDNSGLSTNN